MSLIYSGKAAVKAAFFISALTVFSFSANAGSSPSYRDLSEKARNLLLQKDRTQAQQMLLLALQKDSNKDSRGSQEAKTTLVEISSSFMTDRGLQFYETALNNLKNDGDVNGPLGQSIQLEGEQLDIYYLLIRNQIRKDELSAAKENFLKIQPIAILTEEGRLLESQLDFFLKKPLKFSENDLKKQQQKSFWLALLVEKSIQSRNRAKTQALLDQLRKTDPLFPEIALYDWLLSWKPAADPRESQQKYAIDCKNVLLLNLRRYILHPKVCRRVLDVEKNKIPKEFDAIADGWN